MCFRAGCSPCPEHAYYILHITWNHILNSLNMIYEQFIGPLFFLLGQGLNVLILKPLVFLKLPVSLQIMAAALVFAAISILLRRFLRVKEHELEFRKKFAEKYSIQEDIAKISDWKIKSLMFDYADKELDEFFNNYMAQKYVKYVAVYLLPLFFGEIWLNSVFSPDNLYDIHGSTFALPLPPNSLGIHGLTVSALFLITWVIGLMLFGMLGRFLGKRGKCA